jgi:hypothetical protein
MRQPVPELAGIGFIGEPERARKRNQKQSETEPGIEPFLTGKLLPVPFGLDDQLGIW